MNIKNVLFFDSSAESNEQIELFIKTVSAFKNIKCELSPFDVDARRKTKPLLATVVNNAIQSTDIFSYDELAIMGKEGYKLTSVNNLEEYAQKIATAYKYC